MACEAKRNRREREREAQMRNNLTINKMNIKKTLTILQPRYGGDSMLYNMLLMPHLMKSGARTVKIARKRAAEEDEIQRERSRFSGGNK